MSVEPNEEWQDYPNVPSSPDSMNGADSANGPSNPNSANGPSNPDTPNPDPAPIPSAEDLPDWLHPLAKAVAAVETADDAVAGRIVGLERRPAEAVGEPRRSAVLILFGDDPVHGPDLLFVERAKTLRSHPGQPAFPGGKVDPGESTVQTALREAAEETALDPSGVQVFAVLPDLYLTPSDFMVTPVLGWWRAPSEVRVLEPREIASVRRIPVSELTESANRVSAVHPSGFSGPAFKAGSLLIWGFTAALLDGVLRLGGFEREWDATRMEPLPDEVVALARRGRLAMGSALGAGPGTGPGATPGTTSGAASAGGLEALGPLDGSGTGENK